MHILLAVLSDSFPASYSEIILDYRQLQRWHRETCVLFIQFPLAAKTSMSIVQCPNQEIVTASMCVHSSVSSGQHMLPGTSTAIKKQNDSLAKTFLVLFFIVTLTPLLWLLLNPSNHWSLHLVFNFVILRTLYKWNLISKVRDLLRSTFSPHVA